MVAKTSVKNMINLLSALHQGQWDTVLTEIEHQGMQRVDGQKVFSYPKFNLLIDVDQQYLREKKQEENAIKFAAKGSQPGSSDEVSMEVEKEAGSELEDVGDEALEKDTKEKVLKETRVVVCAACSYGDLVCSLQAATAGVGSIALFAMQPV